ncbi:hypothetical protein [Thalassobellus citreus]|uniref:hypothetical protein n=1 Tax=Thalassobellus citreus TaxID=3367752 RepID=UPI0037BA9753
MDSVILITIFDIALLLIIFLTKNNDNLIYDVTPEEEYAKNINAFNENIKAIDDIDLSGYKVELGHLYNN